MIGGGVALCTPGLLNTCVCCKTQRKVVPLKSLTKLLAVHDRSVLPTFLSAQGYPSLGWGQLCDLSPGTGGVGRPLHQYRNGRAIYQPDCLKGETIKEK